MDDVVFESFVRYFNALSKLGYKSYGDTSKMLFLVAIRDFIYNDFRGLITEDDYRIIEEVVYKVFGTNCLIPFPNFCKLKDMNKLHLGDITELVYMAKQNKPEQGGSGNANMEEVNAAISNAINKNNTENVFPTFNGIKNIVDQQVSSLGSALGSVSSDLSRLKQNTVIKNNKVVKTIDNITVKNN